MTERASSQTYREGERFVLETKDLSADKLTVTVDGDRVNFIYANRHGTMGSWSVNSFIAQVFIECINHRIESEKKC